MRRRLVGTTVVVALVTATMFGVMLAVVKAVQPVPELAMLLPIGATAVAVAVLFGVWQARRLSRSLGELATAAERLGSGDPRRHARRYGVRELDRLADALDESASRVAETLATERQLSADASHQLRTPLTALSMRLEETLASVGDEKAVREEVGYALAQVERLAQVVDSLLSHRRDSRAAHRRPVEVDTVVSQQLDEWRPAFASGKRRLSVTGEQDLKVSATPGTLGHVLATLLENALHHGGGDVTLHCRTTAGAGAGSVVVEVRDEGPGVPDELGQRIFEREVSGRSGTGLGLALARDLAEAGGGRLELISRKPAVFAVFLPRAEES